MSYNVWLSDDHRYSMAFRLNAKKVDAEAPMESTAEPQARQRATERGASSTGASTQGLVRQLSTRLFSRSADGILGG